MGDDRDARGPARRARAPPGARRAARWSSSSTRRATRSPTGETGRIFVGNEMAFEGYTGGGSKEIIGGLLSSGDVGHFDAGGRLFIDGRDDEMIVSGGENVFPREVEDLLADHDARRRGRGHRRRGRAVRPAPEGLRRRRARARSVDADELKDHVKANLARYKVPREIVFLDELPRNATGKVLKRELAERKRRAEGRAASRSWRWPRPSSRPRPASGSRSSSARRSSRCSSPRARSSPSPCSGSRSTGSCSSASAAARAWRGGRSARSSSPRCPGRCAASSCCARCRSRRCRSRSAWPSSAPRRCGPGRAAKRRRRRPAIRARGWRSASPPAR